MSVRFTGPVARPSSSPSFRASSALSGLAIGSVAMLLCRSASAQATVPPPQPARAPSTTAKTARTQGPVSVRGSVTDATGAIVPGVTVQLVDAGGAKVAETKADDAGNFTLRGVKPGELTLVVPAALGFAPLSLPLRVTGKITGLKVPLALDTVADTITVGAADQPVSTDPADNKTTVTVTTDDLHKLPVFDQDYIAALTPFLDPGASGAGGVTIVVDGVEMKGTGVSPSAIQEVRINNDPYSTEFTRPGRGRIEIITKPGSPHYHGEFNFTYRDAIFNAANYFAKTGKPPEDRRIYEGHLTGPVGHGGHTTFVFSGDRKERDTAVSVYAVGPNGIVAQNVQAPERGSRVALRISTDKSDNHRLSVQYNFEQYTQTNSGVGGLVLAEAGLNTLEREDDLVLSDRFIFSPRLLNQVQMTIEKDEANDISATNAPSVQVQGAFTGGGAQQDFHRTENTIHLNEVLSYTHGRHYFRIGAQLPQLSRRVSDDRTNRLGTFQFNSLADYLAGQPNTFTVQQGTGRGAYWINEIGSFIQDQVKFSPRLQGSFGLRYDYQTYLTDYNNLAPRISFAYAFPKSKTVVRWGAGYFYDRTGGDFPTLVKTHNGINLRSAQILRPSYPNPYPPGFDITTYPTNIARIGANTVAPYAIQYSAGIEKQVGKGLTLTAGYRGQVQVKSFRARDSNARLVPPNADPSIVYPRPNPALGIVEEIESSGRQMQNGLDLGFRGRIHTYFSGQGQLSIARSYDNSSGISSYPQNQYAPNDGEWGRSAHDRLARFNLIGNFFPDNHWLTLGMALYAYSGGTYNELAGVDRFETGFGNARPVGISRNALQSAGQVQLDLLYNHDFHLTKDTKDKERVLSAGLAAFNVTNRANFQTQTYIGTLNSPRFGQPTTAQAPRQMQLSLGYRF